VKRMNLLIRNLPDWVHRALKVEAAQTGKTLQGLVQEILTTTANRIKLHDTVIKAFADTEKKPGKSKKQKET
jgi:plasmid stability protein